jgi:hypothetical protein
MQSRAWRGVKWRPQVQRFSTKCSKLLKCPPPPLLPPNPFVQVVYVVRFSVTECRYIKYKGLFPKRRQSREILCLAALCADDNRSHSIPDQSHHWHRLGNWHENIVGLLRWCELILQGHLIHLLLIRLLASPFERNRTVCVATTHSAWSPRIHGSILAKSKRFFYFQTSVPVLGLTQPPIKFVSRPFLAGWGGRGVKLVTRVHLRPRLRMGGALPPVTPYACNLQRENCFLNSPLSHIVFQNTRNVDSRCREMAAPVSWLMCWNIEYSLASEVTVCKRELPWYSHTPWQRVFNHTLHFPRILLPK